MLKNLKLNKIIKKNRNLYYLNFLLILVDVLYMIVPQIFVAKLMNNVFSKNFENFKNILF